MLNSFITKLNFIEGRGKFQKECAEERKRGIRKNMQNKNLPFDILY